MQFINRRTVLKLIVGAGTVGAARLASIFPEMVARPALAESPPKHTGLVSAFYGEKATILSDAHAETGWSHLAERGVFKDLGLSEEHLEIHSDQRVHNGTTLTSTYGWLPGHKAFIHHELNGVLNGFRSETMVYQVDEANEHAELIDSLINGKRPTVASSSLLDEIAGVQEAKPWCASNCLACPFGGCDYDCSGWRCVSVNIMCAFQCGVATAACGFACLLPIWCCDGCIPCILGWLAASGCERCCNRSQWQWQCCSCG